MKKLLGFQRGVNLGGWLSQGSLEKAHLDTFITESDIKNIRNMGCDHLRLPVDFDNIEDNSGNIIERGFEYIENCILWCKKNGLNLVLDLHKTPGYAFDELENSKGFFDDIVLQERFLTIWDRLSSRFSKYSDMVMFEMLNEVTDFSYSDKWNELAAKCIKVIRKNAPDAYILYGGVGYSAVNAVSLIPAPVDDKIVYNIHCYDPLVFTHQGAYWVDKMPLDFRIDYPMDKQKYMDLCNILPNTAVGALKDDPYLPVKLERKDFFMHIFKDAVDYASKNNTSLYCGEYGVIDLADPKASVRWLEDINYAFEQYGIGRAIWNYKEKDFGIIGDHYKEVYYDLIKLL